MSNEFSLRIELLSAGTSTVFERSSVICEHRGEIIDYAERLGCIVNDCFTIQANTQLAFDELQLFIANLTSSNNLFIYYKKRIHYFVKPSEFLFDKKALLTSKALKKGATVKFNQFYFDDKTKLTNFLHDLFELEYHYNVNKLKEK